MTWKSAAIATFAETGSGTTPLRTEMRYYGGPIPWVKSGELREATITGTEETVTEAALAETSLKLVPAGAVLVAMYGATVGRVAMLGVAATTNQAVCHIVPDPDRADSRYLFHALRANLRVFVSRASGGAQPNISQKIVRETEVPLPPLAEQRRIAAILDRAETLRAKRREAIARLGVTRQNLFLEMFGDPMSNPKMWPKMKFAEVGVLDRGVSKHRPRNSPELLGGAYPLIQTGDVANCDAYVREYKATYSEVGLRQSRMWPIGTLCITIAANIAKTGVLTFPACFPDSIVGFTPNNKVRTEYVQTWLSFLQSSLEANAPESAQKNINLEILRNLKLPVPPIDLQEQYVSVLGKVEELKTNLDRCSELDDALFTSLQSRVFREEV